MLKISQLAAVTTAFLHLKGLDGEPLYFESGEVDRSMKPIKLPVGLTLYGIGSDEYQQAQARAQRRVMAIAKKGRNALNERTPQERAGDVADVLADITASAEGIDLEGRPLREVMRAMFADAANGYITDQVNNFAADWANFSKSAPKA